MYAVLHRLFLIAATAGSRGFGIFNRCDISRCDTFSPDDFARTMRNFPPNEEELREICPSMLEAIDCFESMVHECTGELVEELEASDNETVAQLLSTIQSVMALIKDVCDEESQLGRDFRDIAPCTKTVMSEKNMQCVIPSFRFWASFRFPKNYNVDEMESIERQNKESNCLMSAYEMACNLKNLEETCGEKAKDVILQIVKRPKLLQVGICVEKDLKTLRGEFLDYLIEEKGEDRAFLENAFEFRKK